MSVEFILLAAAIITGGLVLLGLLPESQDEAVQAFRNQCRSDGMDFAETEAALAIRVAFVQLRRRSSDLGVAKDGDISRSDINQIAGALAIGLAAAHGKDAAKSFIGWVDMCPDEEILYDDARAAVQKFLSGIRQPIQFDPQLQADIRAAVTIIR
ncbi:hypothetical protein MesoLjLc_51400 [Mesorhizobium sp. L-8-10]|uniref:hypothetical protein n=1 Tax=Mesorhizobium sp. L-8-10 TaxID=2744523 RepID=UPI0019267D34|nr:hypothetical protein [Mesorhizobium sp. L-8-10]BCH33210.1 hypothetical protein MesoLjLc_51400 [Mesorhizobium sp. L-8-10]